MEMFYLVMVIISNSTVVMPDKYTKEQCELAGKSVENYRYRCVPAPKPFSCDWVYDKDGNLTGERKCK